MLDLLPSDVLRLIASYVRTCNNFIMVAIDPVHRSSRYDYTVSIACELPGEAFNLVVHERLRSLAHALAGGEGRAAAAASSVVAGRGSLTIAQVEAAVRAALPVADVVKGCKGCDRQSSFLACGVLTAYAPLRLTGAFAARAISVF